MITLKSLFWYVPKRWGSYRVLWSGKHFKVKILKFKKGGFISYQKHQMRNELWCFLKGSGRMILGGPYNAQVNEDIVHKGDTVFIKQRRWHQYIADEPTAVLEVQYGSECKESDIERRE